MPIPSRDRLPRPVDISTLYRGAARKVDLIVDQPGLNWKGLAGHGLLNVSRGGSRTGRAVRVGGARHGRGRSVQLPQITGQENRTPRVIGLRSGSGGSRRQDVNWPSWYRRRPLQDITALMEAIERRRAELYHTRESQQEEISVNELEQEIGSRTPLPTVFSKSQPSPGTQALNKARTGNFELSSDFLTPEKRLLNSIEKLRGFWLEDQKRLARTPDAMKAERQKKVRTLMSMR